MSFYSFVTENFERDSFELLKKSEANYRVFIKAGRESPVKFDYKTVGVKEVSGTFSSNELHSLSAQESENIAGRVYASIRSNDIRMGYNSATKDLVQSLIDSYHAPFVDDVLVKTLALYITPSAKPLLMCKYLTLISMFDAEDFPLTCSMAVTSLSHKKYNSVKETLLMTIEVMRFKGALPLLKDLEPYSRKYLEDYKNKIITFLEGL